MVIDTPEPGDDGPAGYAQIEFYDALDEERVVVLTGEEEDWCATFEGRAGGWLAAHELGLGDASTGEPFAFDSATVGLRAIAASEAATRDSDEFAAIEPFLRLPVPLPLACRTAFGMREE